MKKSIYISLAVLMMAACAKDELKERSIVLGPDFTASFEDKATKTFADSDLNLRWTADDRISIFTNTYNQQYRFKGKTGDNSGTFTKVQGDDFSTGNSIDRNYAVYPYSEETSLLENGELTIVLPSVLSYAVNSFGVGANSMVAVTANTSDTFLSFKNLCGFLEFKLYGEGTVKTISIKGNNGEKIAGVATVTPVYGQAPEVSVSGSGTEEITIDCGSGVELGKTSGAATSFWFVIPSVTFSKGFTVTATNTEGWSMVKSVSSSRTVQRNVKTSMPALEAKFDERLGNIAFEDANFKAYCVDSFDTDTDGEISYSEAARVTKINCGDKSISSLVGIEYFTALTDLDCSFNELSSLDVSKNTALTDLDCSVNELSSLDVSKNTALVCLYCYYTQLSSLDVSKNTALTDLLCHYNELSSLDVSKNTALTYFDCSYNQLSSLDVSNNTGLATLLCHSNQLSSLDVSNNTGLATLYCQNNQLSSLDISGNANIKKFDCRNNPSLSELWLSEGQNLDAIKYDSSVTTLKYRPYTPPAPEYVDMGLSVKWATFNVGSGASEEYGDHYAWGETETKSDYSWSTYKYCNGSKTTMTKYCADSEHGTVDNKTVLEPEDDVAHVKWGGSWRMPTDAEWTELRENCSWQWVTYKGANGYKVTSNKEGYTDKSIFLPAAGYRTDTYLHDVGYGGYYRSSSLSTDVSCGAWLVNFNSDSVYRSKYNRYYGFSVRPVTE